MICKTNLSLRRKKTKKNIIISIRAATINCPTGVNPSISSPNFSTITKNAMTQTPDNKMKPDIPSRYNIKAKANKTNAVPVSFCSIMQAIGAAINKETMAKFLNVSKLKLCLFIVLATAKAIENLANSAG